MGTLARNGDYRFDVQLEEGLAVEAWFYEMTCGGDRFEVKHDQRAAETGNLYVEYEHDPGHTGNYQPSGIARTEADCWIFVLGEPAACFVGVATERLKGLARRAVRSNRIGHQRDGSCPTNGALVRLQDVF